MGVLGDKDPVAASEWERQALAAVERWHEEWGRPQLANVDRELRAVRLVGAFPETELVTEFWDGGRDGIQTMAFALWARDFERQDGSRDTPDGVATIVAINLIDPAFPIES